MHTVLVVDGASAPVKIERRSDKSRSATLDIRCISETGYASMQVFCRCFEGVFRRW